MGNNHFFDELFLLTAFILTYVDKNITHTWGDPQISDDFDDGDGRFINLMSHHKNAQNLKTLKHNLPNKNGMSEWDSNLVNFCYKH